jgi:hypothetical protein
MTVRMTFGSGTVRLAFAVAGFAALALGWNAFATRFGEEQRSLQRRGAVFDLAARNLRRTLAELPPPERPRVVVYGSSQIATVRGEPDGSPYTTPHQLYSALAADGADVEVADFSDGGQQVIESLVVHFAMRGAAQPSAVVIGVNLFSMLRTEVRPTLLEPLDVAAVRDAVRAALPPRADPRATNELLEWSRSAAQHVAGRGKTIQERADERIGGFLAAHVPAYANRQVMFDELIDTPLRRDVAAAVQRRLRGDPAQTRTAQAYAIGAAYPVALLALETIARDVRGAGLPMLIVALPFDDQRDPVPFDAAVQARVGADLAAIAARTGAGLLDLSHLLGSAHFGNYQDGSPDNFHYDRDGHAAVGARIAGALAPALAPQRAAAGR